MGKNTISYKLLGLLLGLFLISLASSNGINTINSTYQINKTYGEDYYLNITFLNQEPFTFTNITSDKVLIFDKFDLESGANKTIQTKISLNENFNGQIRLRGDYWATLGESNKTELVTLDSSGLDLCDLNLIQGDSIAWTNTLNGEVKLKNLNTNEYFYTLPSNSNYTRLFDSPVEFDYQVFKIGLPFSQVCHLNIMPTEGYVHNSEYDKVIDLNLNIKYPDTSIQTLFLTDNFTIEYNSKAEDILKVTNNGNNLGKIELSGQWVTFSQNNFDLPSGQSKTISYEINPLIFNTNQTEKTYKINITIQGNFQTQVKTIEVYIPYKQISGINNGNITIDKDALKNYVNLICSVYPELCPTRIVYGNESGRNMTLIVGEEAFKEFILSEDKSNEQIISEIGSLKEEQSKTNLRVENIENSTGQTGNQFSEIKEANDGLTTAILFGIFLIFVVVCIVIIAYFFYKNKQKRKLELGKGELRL